MTVEVANFESTSSEAGELQALTHLTLETKCAPLDDDQIVKTEHSSTPELPSSGVSPSSPSLTSSPKKTNIVASYGASKLDGPDTPPNLQQRLRSVIRSEFDFEILLKTQEVHVIDEEIAKIYSMILQIKQCYETNPAKMAETNNTVPEFTEFYAQFLDAPTSTHNDSVPSSEQKQSNDSDYPSPVVDGEYNLRKRHYSFNQHNSSSFPSKLLRSQSFSTTSTERPSRLRKNLSEGKASLIKPKCIIRRNDGLLVRLVCPKCLRDNFGSAQGFINHCRISHSLELTTHDAAAVSCGIEVEEQDEIGRVAKQRKLDAPNSDHTEPVLKKPSSQVIRKKRESRGGQSSSTKSSNLQQGHAGGKVGGKYRPGFAPSHWSHLGSSEGSPYAGKTLPGHSNTFVSQDRRLLGTPTAKPSKKAKRVDKEGATKQVSTSLTSLGKVHPIMLADSDDDSDEDDIDEDSDEESQEESDESEESEEDAGLIKRPSHTRPRSSAKTLPGSRSSSNATRTPVDSLQKFIPLSRFF